MKLNRFKSNNPFIRPAKYKYIVSLDVETSGMAYNMIDPSDNYRFQIVSIGMVVADAENMDEIESLYLECKWNGVSEWAVAAEKVHGLSKQHLEQKGLDEEEFIEKIATFLYKYFPPDSDSTHRAIRILGFNCSTFDRFYVDNLFKKYQLPFKTGSRFLDASTVAYTTFGCYSSDEVFELLGFPTRKEHNALDDAKMSLDVFKAARQISKKPVLKLIDTYEKVNKILPSENPVEFEDIPF